MKSRDAGSSRCDALPGRLRGRPGVPEVITEGAAASGCLTNMSSERRVRVLYSFPHKLGASRICYTAWQQVNGLAMAGAEVLVFPGSLSRPVHPGVRVLPTLAKGKFRIPYKLLGKRALDLHDWIVARRLEKLTGQVDIVHTWPQGAQRTLRSAGRLGTPAVLERPGAHTRFVSESVQQECKRLGIELPRNHEYAYTAGILEKEQDEFRLAYRLLCPSDFVVRTHCANGVPREKLVRHSYGFDEKIYYPATSHPRSRQRTESLIRWSLCCRQGSAFRAGSMAEVFGPSQWHLPDRRRISAGVSTETCPNIGSS